MTDLETISAVTGLSVEQVKAQAENMTLTEILADWAKKKLTE